VPRRPLVCNLGYPFGFQIVILGKQQLFTENTLTPIIPLLTRRDLETMGRVALWMTVLLSNLVGAFIFAWVAGNTPAFPREMQTAFSQIGHESIAIAFGAAVLRGTTGLTAAPRSHFPSNSEPPALPTARENKINYL